MTKLAYQLRRLKVGDVKMKRWLFFLCVLIVWGGLGFAQEVEKLGEISEIKHEVKLVDVSPEGILVEEVSERIHIVNGGTSGAWIYDINTKETYFESNYPVENGEVRKRLKEYKISWLDDSLFIDKGTKEIANLLYKISSGISFILKKGEGYIVYYVHKDGTPGAVDTEGKIYSNREALEYLKEYDVEKYEESLVRADELGLKAEFERAGVLIWGKTYYKPDNSLNQYDSEGNKYRFLYLGLTGTFISCRKNTDEENLCNTIDANNYSTILSTEGDFSYSWYVGYGGNIYYYIAGEEYTEVFRIRRTWGKADMYSMAINGYTEDNYGKYVKETLSKMNKKELRLLRNTIFALYGVHFKSADLSAHFAKEVWYIDEGKTSGEVDLPTHRQKLVEMIQEAEKSGAR